MPNKKIKKEDEFDEIDDMEETDITSEDGEDQSEEVLPDDIQDALGMNKPERAAKIKEIDYISELENDTDGFDTDDQKGGFGDDFGSDLE
jgi:hypothetical protein